MYSDDEVATAANNLHILILKRNNVSGSTGDGTGYFLTVKKNYGAYALKLRNNAKENPIRREDGKNKVSKVHRRSLFAYAFAMMNLNARMYIAFRSSMISEREA